MTAMKTNSLLFIRPGTFLTLLSLLMLGGCGGRVVHEISYDLGAHPQPIAVDVDAFSGSVVVRSDPEARTVTVLSRLRAQEEWYDWGNNMRQARFHQSLELVNVDTRLTELPDGTDVLHVTTSTEYVRPEHQWIEMEIVAPHVEGVTVRTRGGFIDLVDVRGPVVASNSGANIVVRTSHPLDAPVDVTTTDGNIHFAIRPESQLLLEADAVNGRATLRASEAFVRFHQVDESRFTADLGPRPVSPAVIRTINGDITINIRENAAGTDLLDRYR